MTFRRRDPNCQRERSRLAADVARLLDRRPGRPSLSAAIPVRQSAIDGCRTELRELADYLSSDRPASCEGLRRVRGLLTDPASPVYFAGGPDLSVTVREAHESLRANA